MNQAWMIIEHMNDRDKKSEKQQKEIREKISHETVLGVQETENRP